MKPGYNTSSCILRIKTTIKTCCLYLPIIMLSSILWLSFTWNTALAGQGKTRVLFLPFDINTSSSHQYLADGLSSVLSGRLAARANISPVSAQKDGQQLLRLLANGQYATFNKLLKQSQAEYLILGSLDPLGKNYALTSYVFNKKGNAPLKFEQQLIDINSAMIAVDNLSWDISGKVFNKPKPVQSISPQDSDGVAAFHTAHPDRSYKEGKLGSSVLGLGIGGKYELVTSRRSRKMYEDIKDMNSVDIDGDGIEEILILTNTQLITYQFIQDGFQKLSTIDLDSHLRMHSVTYGDFDKDGIQELFISGNNGNQPSSAIIKWTGQKGHIVKQGIDYYLQAVSLPGEEPILYGQVGNINIPQGGSIFELKLSKSNDLTRIKKIVLPSGIEIYDFVIADISGDGNKETIAITNNNRLQVLNQEGSVLWNSSSQFGAGRNFFGTLSSNEERAIRVPAYIKSRLVVKDMDMDGIKDILIGRNKADHVRFMPRLRYFDGSSIMALKWENTELVPLWETGRLPGYVVNYQIVQNNTENKDNQFTLLFTEAESSYSFAFWQRDSATLNSYTLKVKPN